MADIAGYDNWKLASPPVAESKECLGVSVSQWNEKSNQWGGWDTEQDEYRECYEDDIEEWIADNIESDARLFRSGELHRGGILLVTLKSGELAKYNFYTDYIEE